MKKVIIFLLLIFFLLFNNCRDRVRTFIIQDKEVIFTEALSLYENGNIKIGYMMYDTAFKVGSKIIKFQGHHTEFDTIGFYENGNIIKGHLAEDTTFELPNNKISFGKYDFIWFNENGSIDYGYLGKSNEINIGKYQINFSTNSVYNMISIHFYENGYIKSIKNIGTEIIYEKNKQFELDLYEYVLFDGKGNIFEINKNK